MLHVAETFLHRLVHVRHGGVVLVIDELFRVALRGLRQGNLPQRLQGAGFSRRLPDDFRRGKRQRLEPAGAGGVKPRLFPFLQAGLQGKTAVTGPGRRVLLAGRAGDETTAGLVPFDPAAGLGMQVDSRVPPARRGDEVAVNGFRRAAVVAGGGQRGQVRATHSMPAGDAGDDPAPEYIDAGLLQRFGNGAGALGTAIDQRADARPGL